MNKFDEYADKVEAKYDKATAVKTVAGFSAPRYKFYGLIAVAVLVGVVLFVV
jgi:hypothetical protein